MRDDRVNRGLLALAVAGALGGFACSSPSTPAGDDSIGDGGVEPGACLLATGPGAENTERWVDGAHVATVTVEGQGCERSYSLTTTQPLVDGLPANPRTFSELPGWPSISTNNDMFDALYALALEELRENSVDSIVDGAYSGGAAILCPEGGCFETGRKWTFVWTRDTAYAADLGLASLAPIRTKNSLEFKLSERRGGGAAQLIQDTGSGGSYPVSTDRAVWAIGAWQLLAYLDGEERQEFIDRAWEAVANTIEHDRALVYDEGNGLYLGEQSFLDWREQSYPSWTSSDTVSIHESQALSTNLGHLQLLELGAWLAGEKGDNSRQTLYESYAEDLREAVDEVLYRDDQGLWSTFTPSTLDRAPVGHFDLLGTSLAVLSDLGDETKRAEALRRYPHLSQGPSVIWPQQKEVPIYHNRGIWPFVTAYWLRAARKVGNDAAVNHNLRSLIRGAALNLSNMENFEAVSGLPYLEDGAFSGPVVNSQRQLWSVAGYISAVQDLVFGLDARPDGIRFLPFVTREMRNTLFAGADSIVLNDFPYKGRRIDVRILLPEAGSERGGAYAIGDIRLNGELVGAGYLPPEMLADDNLIEVNLQEQASAADTIALVGDTTDYRVLFAPLTPVVNSVSAGAQGLVLDLASGGEPDDEILLHIYRDGVLVAPGLPGGTRSWTDETASATSASHCYTVEATFVGSGNASQHAQAQCWWGTGFERIQSIGAERFSASGGTLVDNHGALHYEGWGQPGDRLRVDELEPAVSGTYYLQLRYGNGAGPVSTGITCAVKRLSVYDQDTDALVATGHVVMPQLGSWELWADSSLVPVTLEAGKRYRVVIDHDERSINMSDFEHNVSYGGTGGQSGAFHDVNIAVLKLLRRSADEG